MQQSCCSASSLRLARNIPAAVRLSAALDSSTCSLPFLYDEKTGPVDPPV
jgi:hypothetical protein